MELIDFLEKCERDIWKASYIRKIPDPKATGGARYIYEEPKEKKDKEDDKGGGKSKNSFDSGTRTYKLNSGGTLKVYGMSDGKYIVSTGNHSKKTELTEQELVKKYG